VRDYVVELYVSRADPAGAARGAEQAWLAAEELTREGTAVRVVRSIFVPADETCFLLYQAGAPEHVEEAARRGEVRFDRIAEAVTWSRATQRREEALRL
jgi:hypothetical protein